MSNHLRSIPEPVTLAAILAWEFVGNHHSDSKAFESINKFVADPKNSFADRAKAIVHIGMAGMGLTEEQTRCDMNDWVLVNTYNDCESD